MKTNTKELLKHTFSMMEKLNMKRISTDEAKEQANLIKQANNVLKYELDKAIAMQKYENIKIKDIEEIDD
jgi:hypothetical protein